MKNTYRTGHSARTALATTALVISGMAWNAEAQFEITTATGMTGQNFDGLSASGSSQPWANDVTPANGTLDGWSLFNSLNAAITNYDAGTGSGSGGKFYSFGLTGSTDRALGGVGSLNAYFGSPAANTVAGYIAFAATNNSPSTLTSFTLGFDGEQWRNGGNATAQPMVLEYGFGPSFAAVTWLQPGGNFNWTSPVATATAAAVNGNVAGLAAGRGGTVNGLTWANGQTLWLRWIELNDTGSDHGLAIDNFNISWLSATPPKSLVWAPTSGDWNNTATNWQEAGLPPSIAFNTGDTVSFTDSGLSVSTVTVAPGGVSPGGVSVSNATGSTYTISGGPISTTSSLQKTGAGTLVLGAAYSAGLTATEGVVRTAANEVFGDTNAVTMGDGTTLDLNGNNETIGAVSFTGTTVTTGLGMLTVGGSITVPAAASGAATSISGHLILTGGTRKIIVSDGTAAEDLVLNADITGTGRIDFDGGGTVRIGGDNSGHSGGLQMDSGITFILGNSKVLGTGQLFLNGGTLQAAVPLAGVDKLTAPVSLGGNGVSITGNDIEFGGALTFFGNGAKTYNVGAGLTLTFSNSLAGTTAGTINAALNKAGPGTMVFSENGSAHTGNVGINAGTVIVSSADGLGTGIVTMTAATPDALTLNATVSTTIGALKSSGDGTIKTVLGAGAPSATPVVLTISSATDGLYGGAIETAAGHVGGVVKAGSATETLSGPQSYATLKVEAGTLILGVTFTPTTSTFDVTPTGTTATLDITANETIASLNIGAGGVVSLTTLPATVASLPGEEMLADSAPVQAVPEPGCAALVFGGFATLLNLRRRR